MGIKNFSNTFNPTRIIKPKDMRGKTIAIDAMTEMYRAALGAKQTNVLTDASGKPTLHISVVLANILNFRKNNVTQIWVFDHEQDPNSDFHNPMKIGELAKRKKRKESALDKIKSLKDVIDDTPMFSDDEGDMANTGDTSKDAMVNTGVIPKTDEDTTIDNTDDLSELINKNRLRAKDIKSIDLDTVHTDANMPKAYEVSAEETAMMADWHPRKRATYILAKQFEAKQKINEFLEKKKKPANIHSLEKQAFSLPIEMIHDVKLILNFLKIKYIEAPQGFEGEAIASYLNEIGQVDAVYSGDTDPIAYGAKVMWRRNPRDKEIYEYTIEDILTQISTANENIPKPKFDDFLRAAMSLGTDACEKSPGIGAKTVLKKLHNIKLNAAQTKALGEFKKRPNPEQISYYNNTTTPFVECDIDGLINWLVNDRSFNRTRITVQIQKGLNVDEKTITKKTTTDKPKPIVKSSSKSTTDKPKPIVKSSSKSTTVSKASKSTESTPPSPVKQIIYKKGINKK